MPMPSIPKELYYKILLKLPLKALLICKCVCKNWLELISNPRFIATHVNLSTQRYNFSLTFKSFEGHRFEYVVHCVGYESSSSMNEGDQDDYVDMLFKGGSIFSSSFVDLVCSSNGLVCLNLRTNINKGRICFWNPATREYKKLPQPPTRRHLLDFYLSAMGYDYEIKDYKFVLIVELDKRTYQILVYTLGSNSWKKIQDISCGRIKRQSGVLVNGAFHWLGERVEGCSRFIISFDISNHRFNDIQLPKEAVEGYCLCVGVLERYLCAVVHINKDVVRPQVVVWVMQEYGVLESWTKRYIITHERILRNYHSLRLMWYFKNGEMVFAFPGYDKLVIYEPKHETVTEPNIRGLPNITNEQESYFETLVSLNSGMYVGGNGKTEFSIEADEQEEEE